MRTRDPATRRLFLFVGVHLTLMGGVVAAVLGLAHDPGWLTQEGPLPLLLLCAVPILVVQHRLVGRARTWSRRALVHYLGLLVYTVALALLLAPLLTSGELVLLLALVHGLGIACLPVGVGADYALDCWLFAP